MHNVLLYGISLISLAFRLLFIIVIGVPVLVDVKPHSVRERITLRELAVSDDVVNRYVIVAAETFELETGLAIDLDDCADVEDVEVSKRQSWAKACFSIEGGMW